MQPMHSGHLRPNPSNNTLGRGRVSSVTHTIAIICLLALAGILSACSTGGGGDNGVPPRGDAEGLDFVFPFNGQQDVVLTTQMVVNFHFPINPADVEGDISDTLILRAGTDEDAPTTPIDIVLDDNQRDIMRLQPPQIGLRPETTYQIVANIDYGDGHTNFQKGEVLSQFTTRPRQGRPADDGFKVVQTTPGNVNPVTGDTTPFADFDSLRVRFSEAVAPDTLKKGDTFQFTDPDGNQVEGVLQAVGRNVTFDPEADRLDPGTYRLAISDAVRSKFGNTLDGFSTTKNVRSAGKRTEGRGLDVLGDPSTQNLVVEPTTQNALQTAAGRDALPDNPVSGLASNLVTVSGPLVGKNFTLAANPPLRGGLKGTLSAPGIFGDVLPGVARSGQKAELTGLEVSFNGDIPSQLATGPANIPFANDSNLYVMANDLRNITTPTAVKLRVDLDIGSLLNGVKGQNADYLREAQANGALTQTVLNIQAAGLAIPQDDGDLALSAIGTFIINVNRDTNATVDLGLTLVVPLDDAKADEQPLQPVGPVKPEAPFQPDVQPDTKAPFPIAQFPSACFYLYGNPGYDDLYGPSAKVPPATRTEQTCKAQDGATINSFPIESSPAVTFSEAIDPISVGQRSVQLTGPSGNVDADYRAIGSTIIVDPQGALEPDTEYTLNLSSGDTITDLGGNAVDFSSNSSAIAANTITFTTEPMVAESPEPSPPLLSDLTPGIACALGDGGDFRSGGDQAGNCVGDAENGTFPDLPVFRLPANKTVDVYFTEPVQQDSVVLANGCLTSGGDSNSDGDATVAIQRMDGEGQCEDNVDGALAFGDPDSDITRSFSFRPEDDLEPGTRYWVVICGTRGPASCSTQIVDEEGLALDTNPLQGTGSTDAPTGSPTNLFPGVGSTSLDQSDLASLGLGSQTGGGSLPTSLSGLFGSGGVITNQLDAASLAGTGGSGGSGDAAGQLAMLVAINNALSQALMDQAPDAEDQLAGALIPTSAASGGSVAPQGGPDILMPFDATDVSVEYYTNAFTLPKSDTNGNGQFDNGEHRQPPNRALATVTSMGIKLNNSGGGSGGLTNPADGSPLDPGDLVGSNGQTGDTLPGLGSGGDGTGRDDGRFPTYASGVRPTVFRKDTLDDCGFLAGVTGDDGVPAVGDIPDQCIAASLLNGGFNFLTSINIGPQELLNAILIALSNPLQNGQTLIANLSTGDLTTTLGNLPLSSLPSLQSGLNGLVGAVGGTGGLGQLGDLTGGLTGGLAGVSSVAGVPANLEIGGVTIPGTGDSGGSGSDGGGTTGGLGSVGGLIDTATGGSGSQQLMDLQDSLSGGGGDSQVPDAIGTLLDPSTTLDSLSSGDLNMIADALADSGGGSDQLIDLLNGLASLAGGGGGGGGAGPGTIGDLLGDGGLLGLGDLGGLPGPLGDLLDLLNNPDTSLGDLQDALNNPLMFASALLQNLGVPLNALGAVQTGRVILRYPNGEDALEDTRTQAGYIVKSCTGTLNGDHYNFKPCFVAQLRLVVNAPDQQNIRIQQQTTVANAIGPVTFEQNGRLVIDAVNVNSVTLSATAFGLLPTKATIKPGALNLQLTGNPVLGGRAAPTH